MWKPIGTEHYDEALELAVLIDGIMHWRSTPCRRVIGGWVHCDTHTPVRERPTHWRPARTGSGLLDFTSGLGVAPGQASLG